MDNSEKLDKILSSILNEFGVENPPKDSVTKAVKDNIDTDLRIKDMQRTINSLSKKVAELEYKNYHLSLQLDLIKMDINYTFKKNKDINPFSIEDRNSIL